MTRSVPKPQWPALLELLGFNTLIRRDFEIGNFTEWHELDGKTYTVVREYDTEKALDISVRDD